MPAHILVATSSLAFPPKGFVFELSQQLARREQITLLAPLEKGMPAVQELQNIQIHRYPYLPRPFTGLTDDEGIVGKLRANPFNVLKIPFFLLAQLFALRRLAAQDDIKLIHAHWLIPQGFIAALYKKNFHPRVKVLVTGHGSDIHALTDPLSMAIKKFTLAHIDHITVVSNQLTPQITSLGYTQDIPVIPMGIDTQLFSPTPGEVFPKDSYNLFFVGWFNKEKGIEYLLRAMPRILEKFPNITLTLGGDGKLREELERLTQQLHIQDRVLFKGVIAHSELPTYYSSADIVLMPSLNEGSPMVLPEALACGAIVVTSDLPVYQEHVRHGVNGFITRRGDPDDIAEKVIHILAHYPEIQSMKLASRQYIVEHFDWSVIGQQYINLLNRLIEKE